MLAAIEHRLPAAYVIEVEFKKPVLIPSTVRFVAHREPATGDYALALRAHRKGTVHARGSVMQGPPADDFTFGEVTV